MDEIRRNLSSCGVAEQLAVQEGRASAEQAAVAFPVLPGSHLEMRSPALEFVKLVSHLASLEPSPSPSPPHPHLTLSLALALALALTLTPSQTPGPTPR